MAESNTSILCFKDFLLTANMLIAENRLVFYSAADLALATPVCIVAASGLGLQPCSTWPGAASPGSPAGPHTIHLA